jgi:hypothetical protein
VLDSGNRGYEQERLILANLSQLWEGDQWGLTSSR